MHIYSYIRKYIVFFLFVFWGIPLLKAQEIVDQPMIIDATKSIFEDSLINKSVIINNGELIFGGKEFINEGRIEYKSTIGPRMVEFRDNWVVSEMNISGSGVTHFYNVLVKRNVKVNLLSEIHVFANFDFSDGIVLEKDNGLTIFEDKSSCTNMSDSSHIEGKVRKLGKDEFVFPIGDEGYYRPASLSSSLDDDVFQVEYIYKNPLDEYGTDVDGKIVKIDSTEYWVVEHINGTAKPELTLTWDKKTTGLDATEVSEFTIVRWDGSKWINEGGISTGTLDKGRITATVSEYGVFSLALLDNIKPVINGADIDCGGSITVPTEKGKNTYTHRGTNWDVTASDNSGVTPTVTYELSGATTEVTAPNTTLDGQVFNLGSTIVKWTAKDAAGNVDTCTFTVIVEDKNVPNDGVAPVVEITEDANNDGYINKEEMSADNLVDVKVSFDGAKVEEGDKVVVTLEGGDTKTITVDATAKTNGYITTDFPSTGHGTVMVVKAKIVDDANNESEEGKDEAKIDTSDFVGDGKGVGIEITTDANNDEVINKKELEKDLNKVKVTVRLPEEAVAGDKLFVEATGNTVVEMILTPSDLQSGKVLLEYDKPNNGVEFVVTAIVADKAGNKTKPATDKAVIKLDAPDTPIVNITEDKNNDGYINSEELDGEVDVRIDLPKDKDGNITVKEGDAVVVTDNAGNTRSIVLSEDDIKNENVKTDFPAPDEGKEIEVKAVIKDKDGNVSPEGVDSALRDTTVFEGLAIEITEDENNDGFISASEFKDGDIDVRVTIPKGAVANDIIVVTGSSNTDKNIVLTADDINKGYLDLKFDTAPVDGATFKTTAIIKDIAGNHAGPVEDEARMELSAPASPMVTIDEDKDNDGIISKEELFADGDNEEEIKVSVTLPEKVEKGEVLIVEANAGHTYTHTLTEDDIKNGTVSIPDVKNPGNGKTIEVTAKIKDKAGNLGKEGKDSALVDAEVPNKPIVDIQDGGDGHLNKEEVDNGVKVKITPDKGTQPGDKLIVDTDGDDDPDFVIDLTEDDIENGVIIDVPEEDVPDKGELVVDAKVVDKGGNESEEGTDSSVVDTDVPNGGDAPVVELIDDINNDGFINKEEWNKDGNNKVDAKVSFDGTKVNIGDTIKVVDNTDPNNIVVKPIAITEDIKKNGFVVVEFDKPEEGSRIIVTSIIIDTAGNKTKEGKDTAKLDTSDFDKTGVGVEITTDANNDEVINKEELEMDKNTVKVTVKLPEAVIAGDILIVEATGNSIKKIILDSKDIEKKAVDLVYPAPANGVKFITTAQVKDPAGNESKKAEDKAVMKLSDPKAPIVNIIEDKDKDGFITDDELDGDIDVEVELPDDAPEGGEIVIVDNSGNTHTKTITPDVKKDGKVVVDFPAPKDGDTITVISVIKDKDGNESPKGEDSAEVDLSKFDGLEVEITEDEDNDGIITKDELKDNDIDVTVTLPKDVEAGDNLQVGASGNIDKIVILTDADVSKGSVDLSFDPTANNTNFVVTAIVSDAAGNVSSPATDTAKIELGKPGRPVVVFDEDKNKDGFINSEELDGDIDVSIIIPGTAGAGDVVHVDTNEDGIDDYTRTLTIEDVQDGAIKVPEVKNPGDGKTLVVVAHIVDIDGNKGDNGDNSVVIDISGPNIGGDDNDPNTTEVSCETIGDINVNADLGETTYTHKGTDWNITAIDVNMPITYNCKLSGATVLEDIVSLDEVVFNIGQTIVEWTAMDNVGNTSTCTFAVTVTDGEAPTIDGCEDLVDALRVVDGDSYTHSDTTWDIVATDNTSTPTLSYKLSGATVLEGKNTLKGVTFKMGETNVVWIVKDAQGNEAECSFVVTVKYSDSDGDGVTDEQEIKDGTDPKDPCSFILEHQSKNIKPSKEWLEGDCDEDGLTNGEEATGEDDPKTDEVPERTSDPLDPCDPYPTKPHCPGYVDCDSLLNNMKIPEFISPGREDGKNDVWNIKELKIYNDKCLRKIKENKNKVQIFNRWGALVFERVNYMTDLEDLFYGSAEGDMVFMVEKSLPSGVYFYVIDILTPDGKDKVSKTGYLYIESKDSIKK